MLWTLAKNVQYRNYILIIGLMFLSPIVSAKQAWNSGVEQVQLLELYSTQSCSSCPPAQDWVSQLKLQSKLWKTFVPVVFHVDYWDYLGWKDPFSQPQFTERQRRYSSELSGRVYTPMFVVSGKEGYPGSASGLLTKGSKVGNLQVEILEKDKFMVSFTPWRLKEGSFAAYYALIGSGISTSVTAGENQGKKLRHDFLVLKMEEFSLRKVKNKFVGRFKINFKDFKKSPQKSIVVWVSRENSLKPYQVVGHPLKD